MKDSDFQLDVVAVRLVKDSPIYSSVKISDPKSAIKAMGEVLKDLDREVLGIINLKADDTPINCHIVWMPLWQSRGKCSRQPFCQMQPI